MEEGSPLKKGRRKDSIEEGISKKDEILHGPRPIASSEESIYFGIINSASNNRLRIS
jgi:hypothetical protein